MKAAHGMEVWLSEVVLQEEASNRRKLRRLRAGVVSITEKARQRSSQVWNRKASESESLQTCRKHIR